MGSPNKFFFTLLTLLLLFFFFAVYLGDNFKRKFEFLSKASYILTFALLVVGVSSLITNSVKSLEVKSLESLRSDR